MTESLSLGKRVKGGLEKITPGFVFALLLAQPFLDVISYWANQWEFTVITTLTRFGMFVAVMLYAFIISDKKRVYIVTAAVMCAYWILHMAACLKSEGGYASPISDLNSFIRTVQLPLFTLAFITCFKKSDEIPGYVKKAFFINFVVMMHFVVLSYMTASQIYTYGIFGKGLMGWVVSQNAQSAILSAVTPLSLLYAYKKQNIGFFYATALVCFVNLFFVGTRVDYFTIPITGAIMLIMMIIQGEKKAGYYAVLAILTLLCLVCFKYSIVSNNLETHTYSMGVKQERVDEILNHDEPGSSTPKLPPHISREVYDGLDLKTKKGIRDLYELYCGPMVQRFGFNRVFEKYDYSLVVSELTAQRQQKRFFAELVWDDSDTFTRLFGFEYDKLTEDYIVTDKDGNDVVRESIFDLENDFPAVFYFGGYVGFSLYMLFLVYFALLILVGVITRFKRIVTVESGMVGATFALMMGTAQFAGYVLRRPNSSIYLSVILAYVYYLTVMRENVRLTDIFKIFSKNKKF